MTSSDPSGFTHTLRQSGEVEVRHHGVLAAVLRGKDAHAFLAKAERASEAALQHLLARVTGNYKRGNERQAQRHPRRG
jgi:hypothetical protein